MSESTALATGKPTGRGHPPEATRFRPGQSGNPNGRPKRLVELKTLGEACYPQALRRLAELIDSRNEETAKWAIVLVLSYMLGKPTDSVAVLEGFKARLGETLGTPLLGLAFQAMESVPAPSLTAEEPQAPDPPLAPPEPPAVTPVGGEALGFTMTAERAEFLKGYSALAGGAGRGSPEPAVFKEPGVLAGGTGSNAAPEPAVVAGPAVPLRRCLYRTPAGQCGDVPLGDGQWCAVHKAKLFASLK